MISEYFQSISAVQIGGLAGLFVSVALFFGVVIRTARIDPLHVARMAQMPLDQIGSPEGQTREEHLQKDSP